VRRLLPLTIGLCLAAAACSGSDEPPPRGTTTAATGGSTTSSAPSPEGSGSSPAPTQTPGPEVDRDVELPDDLAPVVDDPAVVDLIAGGDLGPLAPPGASFENRSARAAPGDPADQLVLTWLDGFPPQRRSGLVVWQRIEEPPGWLAVYAFTDPVRAGVFGIRTDTGDLTGDGVRDLLSFEDVGGSGACGTYRVVAFAETDAGEIFRRDVCDTQIAISGGDLRIREAVYRADDPHCCPSAFRESTLRWNGTSWDEISSEVVPVDAGR
jgi:hypothetical protein